MYLRAQTFKKSIHVSNFKITEDTRISSDTPRIGQMSLLVDYDLIFGQTRSDQVKMHLPAHVEIPYMIVPA